jgi:hypothetical protein
MKKRLAVVAAVVTLCFLGVAFAGADELGFYQESGTNTLAGPSYDWWYGCSPTSAGMMMGYYDRNGYAGLSYSNLVPGGVAETTTFPASNQWNYLVKNIIASQGYVNDFYRLNGVPETGTSGKGLAYGKSGDDATTNLHAFNCLADFMGTSQDSAGNVNGSTKFYYFSDGAKFYARDAFIQGVWSKDGMYGMDEYLRYAGYGTGLLSADTNFYTQHIYSTSFPLGFTFADYKAEINAGRVVMIQLDGHSVFGYGYDDNGQIVYLNDTWSAGVHSMTWGGSYSGLAEWGVVCFTPTGGSAVPLPSTFLLMVSGLAGLAFLKGRFRQK